MHMNVDLNAYKQFVDAVTSGPSKDLELLIERMRELNNDFNVPRLLTASIGLASEAGEFDELTKKLMFQGKPWNEDVRFHMIRELGDVAFYWAQACLALDVDPNDVLIENENKLKARYPNGFNVQRSENREVGDI
jgi:NTP pyrophosphatase (non-canonical NTP hydrolase)